MIKIQAEKSLLERISDLVVEGNVFFESDAPIYPPSNSPNPFTFKWVPAIAIGYLKEDDCEDFYGNKRKENRLVSIIEFIYSNHGEGKSLKEKIEKVANDRGFQCIPGEIAWKSSDDTFTPKKYKQFIKKNQI